MSSHLDNSTCLEKIVFTLPDVSELRSFVDWLFDLSPGCASIVSLPGAGDFFETGGKGEKPKGPKSSESTLPLEKAEANEEAPFESSTTILRDAGEQGRPYEDRLVPHSRPLLGSRYVLLEEVGRGGMSVVYLAWDLILRHVVAIKLLRPEQVDEEFLRHEAKVAFDLSHDGIVRVYHFEPKSAGAGPYLVMEYLPWTSGEKWIADAGKAGLPTQSVLEVGSKLSEAVEYAHSRNVLHLDIKPSNVFVDTAGERVKLADFGLSRVLLSSSNQALQLRLSGTPGYMAPEQKVRGAKVGTFTDVYQMAATLWDFLTGHPPGDNINEDPGLNSAASRIVGILRPALVEDPRQRPSLSSFRAGWQAAY